MSGTSSASSSQGDGREEFAYGVSVSGEGERSYQGSQSSNDDLRNPTSGKLVHHKISRYLPRQDDERDSSASSDQRIRSSRIGASTSHRLGPYTRTSLKHQIDSYFASIPERMSQKELTFGDQRKFTPRQESGGLGQARNDSHAIFDKVGKELDDIKETLRLMKTSRIRRLSYSARSARLGVPTDPQTQENSEPSEEEDFSNQDQEYVVDDTVAKIAQVSARSGVAQIPRLPEHPKKPTASTLVWLGTQQNSARPQVSARIPPNQIFSVRRQLPLPTQPNRPTLEKKTLRNPFKQNEFAEMCRDEYTQIKARVLAG